MSIQAIIFDMDGVLVDSEPLWERADREFRRRHNLALPEEISNQLQGRTEREVLDLYREHAGLQGDRDVHATERIKIVSELLRTEGALAPGVFACLQRLQRAGYVLALASSSTHDFISFNLKANRLTDFFPTIVSGEEFTRGKPASDIYLEAARRLSLPPKECVAVEDSVNGIRSALAAGMPCLALANSYVKAEDSAKATRVLQSFDELTLELLRNL